MKAAIYRHAGCIELAEKPVPSRGSNEILLRVTSVGICGTDLLILRGGMPDRAPPGRILGHEMVGVVVEGDDSPRIRRGGRVVVEPTVACGRCLACKRGFAHVCQNLRFLGIDADGALQEFWSVPADRVHSIASAVPDEHAALVEPLAVAVHDVRVATIKSGETVAIIGGGPIGLMIALLSRRNGARVIVLELNSYRVAYARKLGFAVCDVSKEESQAAVESFTSGSGADVVFEVSGSESGACLMTALAGVGARLIAVGIQQRNTAVDLFQIFYRELTLHGVRAYTREDFAESIRLIEGGEIQLDGFVSRRFPLCDAQEAFSVSASAPMMKTLIDLGKE